ncbi:MAG TPA: sugar ABC transporter permease [Bacilli bacterium]
MKTRLSIQGRHYLEGYLFVAPWLIGFFIFMANPLLKSLVYSFQELKVTAAGLEGTYVGLKNYLFAFTVDVNFLPYLWQTFTYLLVVIPVCTIFALASALILNKPMYGRSLFRAIFFLPVIIASGVVLQKMMDQQASRHLFYDEGLFDTLNLIIPTYILFPILGSMDVITFIMWQSGVQILIFLAGLQTISPSLYEAAQCDGATRWESFWKITLPMIVPMIFVNILFTIVHTFTAADNVMMDHIRWYVLQSNYGYSAAMGWLYFLVCFAVIGFVFFLFRNSNLSLDERKV